MTTTTLKQARLTAGVTMQKIIAVSGVSRPTLMNAENGTNRIRYVNAAKIVNALNYIADTDYTVESLGILTY